MNRVQYRVSVLIVMAGTVAGCGGDGDDGAPGTAKTPDSAETPSPPAAVEAYRPVDPAEITANNRGVGFMGRYEYGQAIDEFAPLAAAHPNWFDVRVNLAIATFNRQEEGDEVAGLAILESVIADAPQHLRAHYCAGLLKARDGADAEAAAHFAVVVEGDPGDGYAAYHLAHAIESEDRERAAALYAKCVVLEPYMRSAYYRLASVRRQQGKIDEAQVLLADFSRLDSNPQAITIKMIYTRMGRKAECTTVDVIAGSETAAPTGPRFAAPRPLVTGAPLQINAAETLAITGADVDGDGDLDLFLTGIAANSEQANLLVFNDGAGTFTVAEDHLLADVPNVTAALWGDFDNDGRVDVYLCRNGGNQLWQQVDVEEWIDVTDATGVRGDRLRTVDGAFFDADHDGDLDLFCVNADGPNELFSNNGDGTFRALAEEAGIAGDRASRGVIIADLDGSRDLDIVVLNETAPHEVYFNDRLWSWKQAKGMEDFENQTAVLAGVAADRNADGWAELIVLDESGQVRAWQIQKSSESEGRWRPGEPTDADPGARQLAVLDLDGSGDADIVTVSDLGFSGAIAAWAPIMLDPSRGPAVVTVAPDGTALIHDAGPGRSDYLGLDLLGRIDSGKELRSNAAGIGTQVAVRTGSKWTVKRRLRDSSGPGQSLQPMAIGLGGAAHADVVFVNWPDGTFQSEVHGAADGATPPRDLAVGHLERIVETQRQVSSCPVIFAWNGTSMQFVSDVLGVAGLGYLVEPGTYAPPRPWERFLLPVGAALPRDGRLEFVLAEPMEEACYLDAVSATSVDVPPGWFVALDERMAISGPEPTGEMIFYRVVHEPSRAWNDRGQDVLAEISQHDDCAAPVGELDHRFIGRLAQDHQLTMEFAAPLDATRSLVLLVDGWIEYPYSQTMFAAWQAEAPFRAPTLEARAGDQWYVVAAEFGYPAGMPREMALPLTALPEGTTALRLTTNQEIYWDRIRVVEREACPEARVTPLPMETAVVERTGFPRRTTGAQRRPWYDFEDRAPFWDTRHQAGYYTAFGAGHDLVATRDGALAIFGPGEGIRIRTRAPGELPEGWSRRIRLDLAGWCKDMDLFTRDGETLAPLPGGGGAELHQRFNTRFEAGR